jgi:hypothetical protein
MVMSVVGITIIIIGVYLFTLLYPALIFGLTILLVAALIDAFWIRIVVNNNLGELHLLGIIVLAIGLIAIDPFGSSWTVAFVKMSFYVSIAFGAFLCFIILRKTN